MPFTPEQKTTVKNAVEGHLAQCPVCRSQSWLLQDELTFLPNTRGKGVDLGSGQACVSVACNTCGLVLLFNVFPLGVADAFGLTPSRRSSDAGAQGDGG